MKDRKMLAAKACGGIVAAAASSAFVLAPSWGWAQAPAAPARYGYGQHMMGWDGGWYGMLFGPLIMIFVLAAVIAVAILFARGLGGPGRGVQPPDRTPLEILKARYARGDIEKEEFEERRRILGD